MVFCVIVSAARSDGYIGALLFRRARPAPVYERFIHTALAASAAVFEIPVLAGVVIVFPLLPRFIAIPPAPLARIKEIPRHKAETATLDALQSARSRPTFPEIGSTARPIRRFPEIVATLVPFLLAMRF